MATLYLAKSNRDLIERLYGAGKPFRAMWEVAIFSAVVAADVERWEALKSQDRGQEIPDRIFISNDKLGLIYLLAVANKKSSEILSASDDDDIWRVFEGYTNAGLDIIRTWLQDNPTDLIGDTTLIAQISEKARTMLKVQKNGSKIDPSF